MTLKNRAITRLEKLNLEFDRVLSLIEPIADSELIKKPSKKEWSVVQIFNHLKESERLSLAYLLYKEKEGASFPQEKISSKIKFFIYRVALISPFRFTAPVNLSNPSNEDNLESIQKSFTEIRIQIADFLERQDESFFKTMSYKHPAAGRISIEKMLIFLRLHLKHHEKQMLRTLIKISK